MMTFIKLTPASIFSRYSYYRCDYGAPELAEGVSFRQKILLKICLRKASCQPILVYPVHLSIGLVAPCLSDAQLDVIL